MAIRRYSRRALMKSAGIAPILALGCKAWANPEGPAMEDLRNATHPFPKDELPGIVDKALNDGPIKLDPKKKGKFEAVVRVLWKHFTYPLYEIEVPPSTSGFNFLNEAYIFKTGQAVIRNINEDDDDSRFDPFGRDYTTNYCAYSVGYLMAEAVENGHPFDATTYEGAWRAVKEDMEAKLARARSGGAASSFPGTGLGC